MDHAVIGYLVPAGDWDVFELEDRLIEAIDAAGVGEFDGNLWGRTASSSTPTGRTRTPSSG